MEKRLINMLNLYASNIILMPEVFTHEIRGDRVWNLTGNLGDKHFPRYKQLQKHPLVMQYHNHTCPFGKVVCFLSYDASIYNMGTLCPGTLCPMLRNRHPKPSSKNYTRAVKTTSASVVDKTTVAYATAWCIPVRS